MAENKKDSPLHLPQAVIGKMALAGVAGFLLGRGRKKRSET